MQRFVLGGFAMLLLVAAGLFWWQGRAETEAGAPPPDLSLEEKAAPGPLPSADPRNQRGPAPPTASEATREQRRFGRLDRDLDGRISRNEMMATRTNDFRRLDTDGNNLLTFEEWAVATGNRFKAADADGNLWLTREEFATTRQPDPPKPKCKC